jgi:two-component system LytT family response regulator
MTHALRVVVVDDEPLARERVTTLVRESDGLTLVGEGSNGLDALDLVATLEPDLLFIDVEMPELDGFGVIASLDAERVPAIVFITAFEHYALRAFEVDAVDYLHKPVTRARFAAAVERVRARIDRHSTDAGRAIVDGAAVASHARGLRTRFVVRRGNRHSFVPVDQVDWIDVADNYLQLHVGTQAHLCRGTMKQAEDELDPARFVRIHRSAMVAVDRIRAIRTHESGSHVIEMIGGAQVRTSRPYAERVRALLR